MNEGRFIVVRLPKVPVRPPLVVRMVYWFWKFVPWNTASTVLPLLIVVDPFTTAWVDVVELTLTR
jgi:hypothetical protein